MKKIACLLLLASAALSLRAAVQTFDNYRKDGRPLLIPEVQSYKAEKCLLPLPAKFTVAFPAGEDIILEQLTDELKRFPGVAVAAGGDDAFCRFILTEKDVPQDPQGYKLVIDGKGVTVTSRGTDGLFYGAQTLRNLIRNAAKPEFEACSITDWPDFEERSYTLQMKKMPDGRFPQLKRAFDVLASLKINRIFMSFGDTFPFSDPNLLPLRKRAYKAEDIRDLYDFCKRRHILIIPTMQVFSHAAWMMSHPDWNKMREDRANPRNYAHNSQPCPLNMQARELTEKVMAENIKFFNAKALYLCLDEICLCPFHECEDCIKHDPKELLKDYFEFVYRVLDKYGAKGYVCQDSFITRVKKWPLGDYCRSLLPKDKTVVRFWDYSDELYDEDFALFKDIPLFGNALCGKPINLYTMAHMIKKFGGKGCGMVHWYYSRGGVFPVLESETPDSLGGIVNGADYLWKLRDTRYTDLGYDGTFEMMRRLYPERLTIVPQGLDAAPVPLEKVVNSELASSGKFPRFESDAELDELKKALAARPEHFRLVTSPGGKYYALRLTGKGRGRAGISIAMQNRKAEYLSFLFTTSRPENGLDHHGYRYGKKRFSHEEVADLTFEYADGTKAKAPLRYKQELTDWNRPFGGLNMHFAVRGIDADQNYYSFGVCDIKNPHPDKPLKSLVFITKKVDNISPAMLALSLRGADKPYKPRKLDLKEFAKRGGVGPDPEPRRSIRLDFENGLGDAVVNAPESALKKLKYEIVDDPTSPTRDKVLKITLPPGQYLGRKSDDGLIRVELNMPFRVAKDEYCFAIDAKVVAAPDQKIHANIYILDHDLTYKQKRKYRMLRGLDKFSTGEWQRALLPFDMHGNNEQRLASKTQTRFCRISFFIGANVEAPIEIYLDNIGTSPDNISPVPLWKEGCEAEPIWGSAGSAERAKSRKRKNAAK